MLPGRSSTRDPGRVRNPRMMEMEMEMEMKTDEFADRRLAKLAEKLDASYGPLTGRQWIKIAAIADLHENLSTEIEALVGFFAVPVFKLIYPSIWVRRGSRSRWVPGPLAGTNLVMWPSVQTASTCISSAEA